MQGSKYRTSLKQVLFILGKNKEWRSVKGSAYLASNVVTSDDAPSASTPGCNRSSSNTATSGKVDDGYGLL